MQRINDAWRPAMDVDTLCWTINTQISAKSYRDKWGPQAREVTLIIAFVRLSFYDVSYNKSFNRNR